MSNNIPQGYDPLIQLGEDAADGAHTHGATIGLVHVTETTIRTALADLIGTPAGLYTRLAGCDPTATLTIEPVP